MKTIQRLELLLRQHQSHASTPYAGTKISIQAALVCEAVDLQLDALRKEFERKLAESRGTGA